MSMRMRKMRTSQQQFRIMVEFMETNGNLTKLGNAPQGRLWYLKKWQELAAILNCGRHPRSDLKWRKVWSDLKINTKRKAAKIKSLSTGMYPLQIHLTDVEKRVLALIGEEPVEKNHVPEVVFVQQARNGVEREVEVTSEPATASESIVGVIPEDRSQPGTNSRAVRSPSSSPTTSWQPPTKTVKQSLPSNDDVVPDFSKTERESKWLYDIEKEKLRQRDFELQLQAQWLDVVKEGLSIVRELLPGKKKDS